SVCRGPFIAVNRPIPWGVGVKASEIRRIAVIGAGEMGHGIAELAALHGFEVTLHDIKDEFIERGLERIRWSLEKLADKGQLEGTPEDLLKRIRTSTDLKEAAKEADFVIEAVTEDIALKEKIFKDLDAQAPADAVLASNTSGLSITTMGKATGRPSQVVGMHFFNPPIIMELVEIVKGDDTDDATLETTSELAKRLKKTPILVRKDIPGFITTRIIFHFMNEGAWIHHEEGVPRETIDAAMKFQVGFPMGPFELADQVGIDLLVVAQKKQGLPVPPPFRERFDQGRLGKKTERGFYDYRGDAKPTLSPEAGQDFDPIRILAPIVNEAATLVEMGVAPPEEIDLAMRLGTAFPLGPLVQGDTVGLDRIVEELKGSKRHEPAQILLDMVEEGKLGKKSGTGFYAYEGSEAKEFKTLLVEKDPETMIATLVLNRPERLNTITAEMIAEASAALAGLRDDPEVRCLVVRGAGERAFCAGADVTSFTGVDKAHKAWASSSDAQRVFKELEDFPKPTVAAVHGYALGGGLEIALACDFRIATKDATLGQVETSLGLIPGAGGTQRLVRLVGLGRAKELVLLAKRIDGEEALAMGLVEQAVAPEALDEAVAEFAGKLAKGPPVALRLAKMLLNQSARGLGEAGLSMEALAFSVATSTEDLFEGISAFLSKKEPKFKGK
ncbi:MAG: 3-hydroxyacyl-CoA dehydrogenase/enoyl-CoA hydratase family protein, partial [Thermoplasmata archaeon]